MASRSPARRPHPSAKEARSPPASAEVAPPAWPDSGRLRLGAPGFCGRATRTVRDPSPRLERTCRSPQPRRPLPLPDKSEARCPRPLPPRARAREKLPCAHSPPRARRANSRYRHSAGPSGPGRTPHARCARAPAPPAPAPSLARAAAAGTHRAAGNVWCPCLRLTHSRLAAEQRGDSAAAPGAAGPGPGGGEPAAAAAAAGHAYE